jgi:molybdate transport system substrate-binding protein
MFGQNGRILLAIFLGLAAAGCSNPTPAPAPKDDEAAEVPPLRVAAASSLDRLLNDLKARGVGIVPILGSSGQHAQQVAQGAPFDVIITADPKFLDPLVESKSVLPDTLITFAEGKLALAAAPGKLLEKLEDLRKPEFRKIALANVKTAPYGRAAEEALRAMKLWDELQPKLVFAESVAQARQLAATGDADAAFIPAGDLVHPLEGIPIAPTLHRPIRYAGAVVASTKQPDRARSWLKSLGDPERFTLLRGFGFIPTGEKAEDQPGAIPKDIARP